MKLKEWIEANGDEFVYVGAQTGWFYCGPANKIHLKVRQINEEHIKRAKRQIKRLGDELVVSIANVVKYQEMVTDLNDRLLRTGDPGRINFLQEQIKETTSKLEYCKKAELENPDQIKKYSLYVSSYVNIMDREIVKEYKTTCKKPEGTNIVVEGAEVSPYWDYDEYQAVKDEEEEEWE